jgi:hypothetical protein
MIPVIMNGAVIGILVVRRIPEKPFRKTEKATGPSRLLLLTKMLSVAPNRLAG